jgi:hypothetical protein
MMAKNLQRQGVPIPDHLNRGQPGYNRQRMNELKGQNEPRITNRPASRSELRSQGAPLQPMRRNPPRPRSNTPRLPADNDAAVTGNSAGSSASSLGAKANSLGTKASDVGGLLAEFLACIALLVIVMFADNNSAYTDKIMSFMKRGSLTCLLFFILSLISATGPNAARICKGLGALVIVGLLVTAPVGTAISDVDKLIKNDWVGTAATDPNADTGDTSGKASKGTAGATNGTAGEIASLEQELSSDVNPAGVPLKAAQQLTKLLHLPGGGTIQDVKNFLHL